jgi:UDP-hydrolysing UDP-N-acetyl-D-glucosamine 2-epimerase
VADILADSASEIDDHMFDLGVGANLDLSRPFVLVSQHPVTTEYGEGERQIAATLSAVRDSGMQAIVLWPNADAGSEDISRGMRKLREHGRAANMHFFKNLPTATYIRLMKKTACLVGNSSSGIREGAYIGTPVVNIGSRQTARERGSNIIDVGHDSAEILKAMRAQAAHGPYVMEDIYGSGNAGVQIAKTLASLGPVEVQKRITY